MVKNILDSDKQKNILILSYGPVPTPEFQKIEGGGMRCWGLATGLRDNGHNVTVGVFDEFKQTLEIHQDIKLYNWKLDDNFANYMNSFDAVIVSYSMGDLSVFVANKLSHHITLVLDCYVPIFIELSARDSHDLGQELKNYLYEVKRFNHVLKRGDFFLCANIPQKHMYAGILGSLGILNPYSYRQDRLLLVPFGIDRESKGNVIANPYTKLTNKNDFVLLWFGGLYPWFNFAPLVNAIEKLSKKSDFKFFLVGGKNPYNNHPDFVRQYEDVTKAFTKLGLLNKTVFLVDWIDFDKRVSWYKNADAVISINQQGDENEYSWRTRVMDYLWGEVPMLTNGGDPLSDELIEKGGALKIDLSSERIVFLISSLMKDRDILKQTKKALADIRHSYYWDKVTEPISNKIASENNLPFVDGLAFRQQNSIEQHGHNSRIIRYARKAGSYAVKARQKGIKRSARLIVGIAKSKSRAVIANKLSKDRSPKAVLLSHAIDDTGAPLVLLQLAKDLTRKFKPTDIHIVSPAIKRHLLNNILTSGFRVHRMATGLGNRVIQADLNINKNDFVLMNTVAVYDNYKRYIFWMLKSGKLNRLYWFIHEDSPKMRFRDKKEIKTIKEFIESGRLITFVPSKQTADDYNKFFETKTIKPVTLRVDIPSKYKIIKKPDDFNKIRFFISGIPLDGRKGQLLFIAALQLFNLKYRDKNPDNYRKYSLDLVAIGDDYISKQIITIGQSVLQDELNIHPVVPFEKALAIASKCNVTVCASLNETFALYVAEGMLMGHIVLRNYTSGWHEQVNDGINGYLFNGNDIEDLADKIEVLLNKKTSAKNLAKMSLESQAIASKFSHADYYKQISDME